jgi:hypothetical protein
MGPPITSRPLIFHNLHYHVQTDIGNELVHQIRRNLDVRFQQPDEGEAEAEAIDSRSHILPLSIRCPMQSRIC